MSTTSNEYNVPNLLSWMKIANSVSRGKLIPVSARSISDPVLCVPLTQKRYTNNLPVLPEHIHELRQVFIRQTVTHEINKEGYPPV